MTALIEKIRNSIVGDRLGLETPFGTKPLVYADYTASGRALSFIEGYVQQEVLPYYANTHTETSFTGAKTTAMREQARNEIRASVNGSEEDQVIFCGPGATAAINKLIDILNLRLPADLSERYQLDGHIPADERAVVFVGPYEHHSNELPWRESLAEVVTIPLDRDGQIDQSILAERLEEFSSRPMKIGSFSAASNVTGVKSDVPGVTALLKQHGALAFWDYAAAAPYVGIDMNAATPIDAVFISPHKFIGGPGTPGVLVVKRQLLNNSVPAVVGGGTVLYVTPYDHRFIESPERREEGGTPAIVESIRAGLVFKLQQEVGTEEIERRENDFVARALKRFSATPNLEVLGNTALPRLPIVSLRFKHGEKDLHYGFVVSLLNDLFGIQVRGGCSCAGPYGHSLLEMDADYSKAIEQEIQRGMMVLRPGWVRLNFNYFISEEEFEYLVGAIELVAEHGWRLLPFYHFDEGDGVWRFQSQRLQLPEGLDALCFESYVPRASGRMNTEDAISLQQTLEAAREELLREHRTGRLSGLSLSESAERLRWFVLPQEVSVSLQSAESPAYPGQASALRKRRMSV